MGGETRRHTRGGVARVCILLFIHRARRNGPGMARFSNPFIIFYDFSPRRQDVLSRELPDAPVWVEIAHGGIFRTGGRARRCEPRAPHL